MAARLNLTPSADGVQRAVLRVEFRVDLDTLVGGVLHSLEVQYGRVADERCVEFRGDRGAVLHATRQAFHEHGEVGFASQVGMNVCPATRAAVHAHVAALFPEFESREEGS